MSRSSGGQWSLLGLIAGSGWAMVQGAEPDREPVQAPPVEIVAPTPLPGVGIPRDKVPANLQTGGAADFRNPGVLTLPDFMERSLDSVSVNAAQGNPFQPDVNFRGFSASPLLGTQPGLSVFQDGVRVNEPFGDSVNWDLIPKSAISSMALIPGANPVFGLNTLGGALVITTKSGFDSPGLAADGYGASFGRRAGEFEYGGSRDRIGYFVTGNLFDEVGWRDQTASLVRQGFAKLSWRSPNSTVDFSYTGASNLLSGGQSVPVSFLEDGQTISQALAPYKRYPVIAQMRGWEGSVTMQLHVAPTGRLLEAEVRISSGYDVLDRQALAMASLADPYPVPPEALSAREIAVLVPVVFRLER